MGRTLSIRTLVTAAFLLLIAHSGAAQEDYPPDGKLGVQYGPWDIRPENGCSVARNIVDADNWSYYSFWVEPLIVEVIGSGMVGGTLTVEGGASEKFICSGHERCAVDRTDLNPGLLSGSFAVLELDLADGKKAGPFEIPLGDLAALLFLCGNQGPAVPKPSPPNREFLNPEPEVNPRPRP